MSSRDREMFVRWLVLQSLDPLPMHGPELGVQADDMEAPDIEREPKQEVLENKDVRSVCSVSSVSARHHQRRNDQKFSVCVPGCGSASAHRRAREDQGGPADSGNLVGVPRKEPDRCRFVFVHPP